MVAAKEMAFKCFLGAWAYVNSTVTDTTTGVTRPGSEGLHPNGISQFTSDGYNTFLITSEDINSVNYTAHGASCTFDLKDVSLNKCGQPEGTMLNHIFAAVDRDGIDTTLENHFTFYNNCNLHWLRRYITPTFYVDLYFKRLPKHASI